jgi:hypothetical protein
MSRESTIKAWLEAVSGYANDFVYQSEQGAPKESVDFITFSVSDDRPRGMDYIRSRSTRSGVPIPTRDLDKDFASPREFMVDVNVYSLNGRGIHAALSHSDSIEAYKELLRTGGLVLLEAGNANRAPEQGDTTYRPRFVGEYTFHDFHYLTETVEKVDTFEINGTIDGESEVIKVPKE